MTANSSFVHLARPILRASGVERPQRCRFRSGSMTDSAACLSKVSRISTSAFVVSLYFPASSQLSDLPSGTNAGHRAYEAQLSDSLLASGSKHQFLSIDNAIPKLINIGLTDKTECTIGSVRRHSRMPSRVKEIMPSCCSLVKLS
jgi:hypothetical protein